MIVHIVLCKPRDDLSGFEIEELAHVLEGLRNVAGVRDFSSGLDFSGREKSYSHAAVMRFANRDTLQDYLQDAEHLRLVDLLNRLAPDRLIVDYETATSGISI
jgi:hypothetical protein